MTENPTADPTIAWGAIGVVYACGQTPSAIKLTMKKLGIDWDEAIWELRRNGAIIEEFLDGKYEMMYA